MTTKKFKVLIKEIFNKMSMEEEEITKSEIEELFEIALKEKDLTFARLIWMSRKTPY
jgi:ferritin